MSKSLTFRYYAVILAVFTAALLISNLAATKLIAFGPIITDGGGLLFPLVYLFGDVLTEVYGYRYARQAIWTGFGVMLLAILAFWLVGLAPAGPGYTNQPAYDAVLGFFPRIVLASLLAYLVGSFTNAYLMARLKVRTQGRRLWQRLVGSTFAGQFLDTVVFGLVAFSGMLSGREMIVFVLVGWLFKTTVEVVMLPVTYRVIAFLKTREHSDAFDVQGDFSPLKIGV